MTTTTINPPPATSFASWSRENLERLCQAQRIVDLVPAVRLGLDGHPMGWVTLPGLTWYAWYDTATNQPQQQNLL